MLWYKINLLQPWVYHLEYCHYLYEKIFVGVYYLEREELYKDVAALKFIDEGFLGDKFDGSNWFLEYEIVRKNKVNIYSVNMLLHQKNKLYVLCFYTIIERKERMDQTFDKISRSFRW